MRRMMVVQGLATHGTVASDRPRRPAMQAILLALAVTGCAEMRALPPAPPATDLAAATADPMRGAISAMASAFADRGRGLAGRPAEAAQAAAQLEYVTAAIGQDPRYARIPDGVRRDLLLARTELRDALGVAEALPPDAAVAALLAAARALRASDARRAAAALRAPDFRPGGAPSVARLGDLGPLPQVAIASGRVAQEVARLDAEGGWSGAQPAEFGNSGITVFGVGGTAGAGY